MSPTTPSLRVAVVMARETAPNAWEDWRHSLVDVVLDDGRWGEAPQLLRDDGRTRHMLFPGFSLALHRDEGEGYYLNLSSGAPVWFVMWRVDEEQPAEARPHCVTLSYNEAGRLLDAQERVDNCPLPGELCAWLQDFTDAHYRPEPKQRKRPVSFQKPQDRQ